MKNLALSPIKSHQPDHFSDENPLNLIVAHLVPYCFKEGCFRKCQPMAYDGNQEKLDKT